MSADAVLPVTPDRSDVPGEFARRNLILAVMCLALVMVVAGVSMLANALPEHRRRPRRQPVRPAVDRRRLRA